MNLLDNISDMLLQAKLITNLIITLYDILEKYL